MNKAAEIACLQKCLTELGPDSYLGPWLTSLVDEVTRDLRNDHIPLYSLKDQRDQCAALVRAATEHCVELRQNATKEAERIVKNAQDRESRIIGGIRQAIHGAERAINA